MPEARSRHGLRSVLSPEDLPVVLLLLVLALLMAGWTAALAFVLSGLAAS